MDPKLRKWLNKPGKRLHGRGRESDSLDKDCQGEILDHIFTECDFLAPVAPGSGKIPLGVDIISRLPSNKSAWLVAPGDALSQHRRLRLKLALGDRGPTFMTEGENGAPDGGTVVWSAEVLLGRLPDLDSSTPPDLIVFENVELLDHPDAGPTLEACLLNLPRETPLLATMSPVKNPMDLAGWLESVRKSPCRLLEPNLAAPPVIPAFLSSTWDLTPLMDKKRLSKKVKRFIRETKPFRSIGAPDFIRRLMALLRSEELTPALVIMPSPADCDAASAACADITKNAGSVLTDPLIAEALDRSPFLKNYALLNTSLSKRAAPLHPECHPSWCDLVEHFLSGDGVDAVFCTLRAARGISTRVGTAVFCIENDSPRDGVTPWRVDRVTRLIGRTDMDKAGLAALAHTPGVDAVRMKDMLAGAERRLEGTIGCGFRKALALLVDGRAPDEASDRKLIAFQHGRFGEFCMEEFQNQLEAELPTARCNTHIRTVEALINTRLELRLRINKLSERSREPGSALETRRAREKQARLEKAFSHLPCETCDHFSLCHKRGAKKFRLLMEAYYDFRPKLEKNISGFRIDMDYYLRCLREFELIDATSRLTREGVIALRSGLDFPPHLIECMRAGLIPADDETMFFALVGGFIASPDWEAPGPSEAMEAHRRRLLPAFDRMRPTLSRTTARMLRFGIAPPEYSLSQATAAFAWKEGSEIDALSRLTGLSMGCLAGLMEKTAHLSRNLREFL